MQESERLWLMMVFLSFKEKGERLAEKLDDGTLQKVSPKQANKLDDLEKEFSKLFQELTT